MYLVSCFVVYIISILALKKLDILPIMESVFPNSRGVDYFQTGMTMLMILIVSTGWPLSLPLGILYYYVVKPKKEKVNA